MTTTFMPTVDHRVLLSILSTAVESGSCAVGMGWAQVEAFRWQWWYEQPDGSDGWYDEKINPTLTVDTPLMAFRDVEAMAAEGLDSQEDDTVPFIPVTLASLEDATHWALLHYNHLFSFHCNGTTIDEIDYDAIGADVILQKAVLGEVIYG
jgi:hypothetical protein